MHLNAERLELSCDNLGGALFLEAKLRIGVKVLPDRGQLGVVARDVVERIHGCRCTARFRATLIAKCASPQGGALSASIAPIRTLRQLCGPIHRAGYFCK